MHSAKERACEVLEGMPDGYVTRPYFEAMASETLPKYYFDELQIRLLYSDELPNRRSVAEWHPDYPLMKCRRNVIFGISMTLQDLMRHKIVEDPGIVGVIETFKGYDWNCQKHLKDERWTSREEIVLINRTLKTVTGHIKDKYGLKEDHDSIRKKYKERLAEERKTWIV